jgi:hypothetical protein
MPTLDEQRIDFIRRSGKFLAFPLAGALVWLALGIASLFVSRQASILLLLFGTGAIFPLALGLARLTGQQVFQPGNRFATLMGQSVLMVNLLWAVHLVIVFRLPDLAPLSVAIGLGLHWIVFGWIIGSPLGLVHTIVRTVLCIASYLAFPGHAVLAVSIPVVLAYGLTILQLLRFFQTPDTTQVTRPAN